MAIPSSLPPDGPSIGVGKAFERLGLANEPGRWTDRYLCLKRAGGSVGGEFPAEIRANSASCAIL